MNTLEKVKAIRNPYKPYQNTDLIEDLFIGRLTEIEVMHQFLDDFQATQRLDNNVIIFGEKSVGKSTLLKRFMSILEGTFETYFLELDKADIENTREFFEKIIDEVLKTNEEMIYDNELDNTSLDKLFLEDWEKYRNDLELELPRAKQFYLQRSSQTPSPQDLERDFNRLINDLSKMDESINGLVIFIDEAHLLKFNSEIIRNLNYLSAEIPNLMVITGGLKELMYDESFTKLKRNSFHFEISGLSRHQIQEAIIKPIIEKTKVSELELLQIFDPQSLQQIFDKSSGNPYHIKVICGEMFEEFSKDKNAEIITINELVINKVMTIFSGLSSERELIENHLKSYSKDDLHDFSKLYALSGGFSLYEMLTLDLAYDTFNDETKAGSLSKIIELYKKFNFLFRVTDYTGENIDSDKILDEIKIDNSPQYKINFIGDNLDKLFAFYYYKQKTGDELIKISKGDQTFEEIMAVRLTVELNRQFVNFCINDNKIINENDLDGDMKIYMSSDKIEWDDRIKNFNKLNKFDMDDKNYVNKSSKFYSGLRDKQFYKNLALGQRIRDFSGYLSINLDCQIGTKQHFLHTYIPITNDNLDLLEAEKIKDYKTFFDASLNEYDIDINKFSVKVISYKSIVVIYVPIAMDVSEKKYKLVAEGRFREAFSYNIQLTQLQLPVSSPNELLPLEGKELDDKLALESGVHRYVNDSGYILSCEEEFVMARKYLDLSKKTNLLSRINLAFVDFMEGKLKESLAVYKKMIRKRIQTQELKFINLCLDHEELEPLHKVAEDVSFNNLCCWNACLIISKNIKTGSDKSAFGRWKKSIKTTKSTEEKIDKRVNYWIEYNKDNKENILQSAQDLFEMLDEDKEKLIFNSVKKDIEIFKNL